jgi:peroxiredoxin
VLKTGDKAPAFVASGTEGEVDLANMLAQGPLVLYFFPRAFTPG